jgi:hypothetical protein
MIQLLSFNSSDSTQQRFCWFSSEGGPDWREAVSAELRHSVSNRLVLLNCVAAVSASLSRLGLPGSPESGDVRRIKYPSPRPLAEVRWVLPGIDSPVHLRMYFSHPAETEPILIGLIFRIKRIESDRYLTRMNQNRDIADAITILETAISAKFKPCVDIRGDHV